MYMVMTVKLFQKNDENFICDYCGKEVLPLKYTSRDHCPYCICSKHVDINPGDRQNTCQGKLKPIEIEKYRDTYKIVYKCENCGELHKNIMASDDDMEKIIEISKKAF